MSDKLQPISRRRVYPIFVVINLILSVFRYFIVPGMDWMFHLLPFLGSMCAAMLSWEWVLFIGRVLEKRFPISLQINIARISIQLLLTFVVAALAGQIIFLSMVRTYHLEIDQGMKVMVFLVYFMIAVVFNLLYFGTIYFNQWKENLVRNERLQREQAEVKYDALRNQLNPHFLFNALTSLNSLIFENQQLASDFLQQLSKVYRYTLQNKDKETVSLKTEIEFINHYISLVKTRFAENVSFNIKINENALEKGIVPVTMQLILENALKHNIISSEFPLLISIHTDDDYLIAENCINKKQRVETSNKQGLENLKTLYKYLNDKPIEIEETEKKFTIKIPLI